MEGNATVLSALYLYWRNILEKELFDMIFAVLGTQKFQFDRLLKTLDRMTYHQVLNDKVFAQIGHSTYLPIYYDYSHFLNKEEFEQQIDNCSILVTHGGVGTIISGISHNKPIIVVPRLKKYNEHIDDHQLQIAEAFSRKNYVMTCLDTNNLLEFLTEAPNHHFDVYKSRQEKTITTIESYLKTLK